MREPEAPAAAAPAGHSATPAPTRVLHVVVLTRGSEDGLVRRLAERGVPCTILLESAAALRECFRAQGWRRLLEVPLAVARSIVRARRVSRSRRVLARWGRVVVTGPRNSPRMVRDLAALAPAVLVLYGMGLVDERVLAVPRLATLNGHPALLPWARGNGVVAHSLARGVAVGATVHRVDAGIDTGEIVARRLLPVAPGITLAGLSTAAVALADELLVDVVATVAASGALPPSAPQVSRHPLCRWMHPDEWRAIDDAVATGLARRLFDRWAPLCEPAGPPWTLPPHVVDAPSAAPPASHPR